MVCLYTAYEIHTESGLHKLQLVECSQGILYYFFINMVTIATVTPPMPQKHKLHPLTIIDLHTKFEKDWTWNTDVIANLKRFTENFDIHGYHGNGDSAHAPKP